MDWLSRRSRKVEGINDISDVEGQGGREGKMIQEVDTRIGDKKGKR